MLTGTRGVDTVYGRGGLDTMYGDYNDDEMRGGANADTMLGGYDKDRIYGGYDKDTIDGEAGADSVFAADGQRDSISCGIGNDRAIVVEADLNRASFEDFVRLTSCEEARVKTSYSVSRNE